MKSFFKELHWGWRVLLCGALLFWAWKIWYLFVYDFIPFGYDPGLYRAMYLAYAGLDPWRAVGQLPTRIAEMYPPLLGRLSLFFQGLGISVDTVVLGFPLVFSFMTVVAVGRLVWPLSRVGAVVSSVLVLTSFVQYSVYRRHYPKQLLAGSLLIALLGCRAREKFWIAGLLVASIVLTHRPAILLLALLLLGVFLLMIFDTHQKKTIYPFLGSSLGGLILGFLLLLPFWESQVLPVLGAIFSAPSVSVLTDGFQTGGTFMTLREFLLVDRHVLLVGLTGFFVLRKKKTLREVRLLVGVLLVRCGLGFFFYQRMLGYFDLFLIPLVGVVLAQQWEKGKFWRCGIILFFVVHIGISIYWIPRISPPFIHQEEFAFVRQIDSLIEDNSLIVVPGIRYSPWIQGWASADVLAPGLFENKRGGLDDAWQKNWFLIADTEKCTVLKNQFEDKYENIYVWMGITQEQQELAVDCFERIGGGEKLNYGLYQLK